MATALVLPAISALRDPCSADSDAIFAQRKLSLEADGASVCRKSHHSLRRKDKGREKAPELELVVVNEQKEEDTKPEKHGEKIEKKMVKKIAFEKERALLKARRLARKTFEMRTGKDWDENTMTKQEWETYNSELRRQKDYILQRHIDEENATLLATEIHQKETRLHKLEADLVQKQQQIEAAKESLEKFRGDFEEHVRKQMEALASSSTPMGSSTMRMREEQLRKKVKGEWKKDNSEDTEQKTRRDILLAKDEVADLGMNISALKKEIAKLKVIAQREASSKQHMREEKNRRDEMKLNGIEKPKVAPKPKQPPPPPPLRSHQQRMKDQQERKMKARAERLASTVSSSSSSSSSSSTASSSSSPLSAASASPSNFASSSSSSSVPSQAP